LRLNRVLFPVVLLLDLFLTLVGEFGMPHGTELAARAAHAISHGRYRRHFWQGSIGLGHLLPLVLLLVAALLPATAPWLSALAGIATLVGLYLFEYAFVMAPQELPNS
ncbi:MAG: 4Fe-4S ferredoxin, partial [Caldilineales bacterium]|nr:4Fe-4S ferredoxin [Caldilineales bacterium]